MRPTITWALGNGEPDQGVCAAPFPQFAVRSTASSARTRGPNPRPAASSRRLMASVGRFGQAARGGSGAPSPVGEDRSTPPDGRRLSAGEIRNPSPRIASCLLECVKRTPTLPDLSARSRPRGGARAYLESIGGGSWLERTQGAGGSDAELLIEFAGRLCYRSWEPGLNPNVRKIRTDRGEYFGNLLASGHGSVLEHANFTLSSTMSRGSSPTSSFATGPGRRSAKRAFAMTASSTSACGSRLHSSPSTDRWSS